MSQQELFDYVMNTPHNTNPAILKQMIDANSSGGITSWNDLEDKPFSDAFNDMIFIEVDAEAWQSKIVGPGQMGYKAIINPVVSDADEFEYGKTYEVRLNDEYFGKWVCDGTPYFSERIKLTNAEGKSYEVVICTEKTTGGRYIKLDGDAVEIANWPKAVFRIGVAGVKTLDEKFIPDTIARVKDIPEGFSGSWNDLTDKPFGKMTEFTPCAMDEEIPVHTGSYDVYAKANDYTIPTFTQNDDYRVTFDGVVYICRVKYLAKGDETLVFGNRHLYNASYDDTGEPFFVTAKFDPRKGDSFTFVVADPSVSHTVSVEYDGRNQIKKIDAKYLPKAAAVANAAGETVTSAEFNALLAALRDAGYLSK